MCRFEIASQTHCTHLDMSVRCLNFPVVHHPLLCLGCTVIAFSILPCPLRYSSCISVHFLPILYLTLSFFSSMLFPVIVIFMLKGFLMLCSRNRTVCVWQPNRWYSIVLSPNYHCCSDRCVYRVTVIADNCHFGTIKRCLCFSQYCGWPFTIQSYLQGLDTK